MIFTCCNSTYRLQYAPQSVRQQRSEATMRPTHCLPEQSEGKTKVIRQQSLPFAVLKPWYISSCHCIIRQWQLQQHLPFTVCVEGCETAEEQSDDEVRTSQVPERSEGKTRVIKWQCLPVTAFTVLKLVVNTPLCRASASCNTVRYWNGIILSSSIAASSCNTAYRLQYVSKFASYLTLKLHN